MSARGAESGRYVVLDGMRGLAALAVIADHVDAGWLTDALPGRYLAVDFFFVLSGFVLSHVYGARLAAGMSVWQFMRIRLIRLYPLYLVGLLAGATLALVLWTRGSATAPPQEHLLAFGLNLFMLPAPSSLVYPFDGPAWSLFFELVVNFAFALLFLRLSKWVFAAILVLSAAGLLISAWWFGQLDGGFAPSNFVAGFPRVFFGFFFGVIVHRASLRWRLPALPSWLAYLLLLALLALPAIGPNRAWTDLIVILAACPVLVAVSAGANGDGWLERRLAWLGAMSYGIYILHAPILEWINGLLRVLNSSLPGLALFAVVATLAIVAAAILDAVYDKPMRHWLSRAA
jgi:peptidoglycan/LPS O-acetylase OafA/YrhL